MLNRLLFSNNSTLGESEIPWSNDWFGAGGSNGQGVEFLGEINAPDSYTGISEYFGVNYGTIMDIPGKDHWLAFKVDGVLLITSKISVRNNIGYDHLYRSGLVYGTNDNGIFPFAPVTNQYRTIMIDGKTFKCRLFKGLDPQLNQAGINSLTRDPVNTRNSEFSRVFYPIVSDDRYIVSYTGPKLAQYTKAEIGMVTKYGNMKVAGYSWCQERPNSLSNAIIRGQDGPSDTNSYSRTYVDANRGWRPVLELIQ